ncbi:MAG: acyltransferase family protein [Lachnospiraceae bacterium]
MSRRNTLLELWRFFFCMAVLAFHFFIRTELDYFHAGYLGVEFFFLVSGYFIGSYYDKYQKGQSLLLRLKSVVSYALSRLKRLYPFYLLALVLMLGVQTLIHRYHLSDIFIIVKNCIAEFFLLQWSPWGNEVLISAGWFVPAVFWGGLFFVLLLALTGKTGGYILSPLISFLIYRYYFNLIGKIDVIFSYHSVLRGIAGIGFGIFVYFICGHLRTLIGKLPHNTVIAGACSVFASILFLCLFVYTNFGHRSKWDFLIIALYGIGLVLLMAGSLNLPEPADKTFLFLGKLTYPIYVFQMPVIELFFALF